MSEEQNPFWLVGRATLAESDQEPFEAMMRRMCAAVLREMQPKVVEAEQAAKQARAELRDRFAGHALEGLLAAGDAHAYNRAEMAAEAWRQADAMLKARGDV
jgi:hypothetical protein